MTAQVLKGHAAVPATKIGDGCAIAFVALSTLIMAYSYLFSTVPILLFYAIWLPQILIRGKDILRPPAGLVLPALFAVWCIFTLFWSGAFRQTLVGSLEYASMIVCAVIIARTVSPDAFLKGLALGALAVLAVLFHTGGFSYDGLFGSKNQVGLYAEIAIFAGLVLMVRLHKNRVRMALYGLPPLLLGLVCLPLSHSASSLLSLAAVLAVAGGACLAGAMPQGLRPVLLGLGVFAVATGAVFLSAFNLDVQGSILKSLGKSPTLTGRTWLWEQGMEIGMEKPLLGHGYAAFWLPGNPDAERMWLEFDIANKSGFHFHNVFIQSFVDLGLVGLLLIAGMIAGNLFHALLRIMRGGADGESVFLLGLAVMFAVRAFVEVDCLGPFGIGALLVYYTAARLPVKRPADA